MTGIRPREFIRDTWVGGVLLLALVGQFAFRRRHQTPLPLTGPTHGAALPDFAIEPVGQTSATRLSSLASGPQQCTALVFVSTECGVCKRMRFTWAQKFNALSDSVGMLRGYWIAPQTASEINSFMDGFGLNSVARVRISETALTRLGVYGTPTTYFIDRSGRLVMGVLGEDLPSSDRLRKVCS
jgi:hypothetical protein